MKPGHAIDKLRGLGFDVSLDKDTLVLKATDAEAVLTDERRAWLVEHKAALVELLGRLPVFGVEEERELVDRYCAAPRAARLAMHNVGKLYHANGWPWRESDLQAMSDHRTKAGL